MPPPATDCPGCPSCFAPARLFGVGTDRRFCIASHMRGVTAVLGCKVDVLLVSCQWLLKYINYEILHRKERNGRKAMAAESFAVFAHFVVKY